MRRAAVLTLILTMAANGAAMAANWQSYADLGDGKQWFVDSDYSYKDKASGRVVVMQAIGVPASKLGPNGPGAADGVGNVVALNCQEKNFLVLGSYTPSKAFAPSDGWRRGVPKRMTNDEDKKLLEVACANVASLPVK
jgi:hypothetical protein